MFVYLNPFHDNAVCELYYMIHHWHYTFGLPESQMTWVHFTIHTRRQPLYFISFCRKPNSSFSSFQQLSLYINQQNGKKEPARRMTNCLSTVSIFECRVTNLTVLWIWCVVYHLKTSKRIYLNSFTWWALTWQMSYCQLSTNLWKWNAVQRLEKITWCVIITEMAIPTGNGLLCREIQANGKKPP